MAFNYVRELYAITQAVLKWCHYLLGPQFVIKTNHKSLRELMYQVVQTLEQQFFVAKLIGFQFAVVYHTRKSNQVADALSRLPKNGDDEEVVQFMAISRVQHTIFESLRKLQSEHPDLIQLHEQYEQGELDPSFLVRDGFLFVHDHLWVPKDEDLRQKNLYYFHDKPLGGHSGVSKKHKAIVELFVRRHMRNDVEDYIKNCVACQQSK